MPRTVPGIRRHQYIVVEEKGVGPQEKRAVAWRSGNHDGDRSYGHSHGNFAALCSSSLVCNESNQHLKGAFQFIYNILSQILFLFNFSF